MTTPLFFNGKFLAQRTTGVQRVAREVVAALEPQLEEPGIVLCPPGSAWPGLRRLRVREVGPPGLPLHAWEQLVLPWAARRGLLVNLAGSAPAVARRQVCVMHDAAVFDRPDAYRATFVLWYRWLFRRLWRHAEAVLTVSEFARQRLLHHLGVPAGGVEVVLNGCDHMDRIESDRSALQRAGLLPGRYFLALGSANPTKNQAALVRAFARSGLGTADFRLVLAGGENRKVFVAASAEPLPEGVCRLGAITDGELKALYQGARAFVFPSTYEGFGLPPLEAMRCGCAVLAARAASIPEVCADAALYFDPTDEISMADALRRIAVDDVVHAELCKAGRARSADLSWASSASAVARRLNALRADGGGR